MVVSRAYLLAAVLAVVASSAALVAPRRSLAQSPGALSSEDLLTMVLPPGPGGTRPGVHMWARADQAQGPGGYPTVFVVTLFTEQGASGPEEHEVINYVQYSSGGWAPARPQGDGTLLLDDWAWISQNLTNLTASVLGSGSSSNYTVDYTASGPSGTGTRQIAVEEVYGADLSLISSTVLSDTNPPSGASTLPASGAASGSGAGAQVTATPAPTPTPIAVTPPSPSTPAPSSSPSPARGAPPPTPPPPPNLSGGNTIRPVAVTPTPVPGR